MFNKKNCTWTWDSSKHGCLVTSKISGFEGNSIFLPAAGYGYDGSMIFFLETGCYWSSSLYKEWSSGEYNSSSGSGVSFNPGGGGLFGASREQGFSIRPVKK